MQDGLSLRDLAKIEDFSPRLVWGSGPLLLVRADGHDKDAPVMFSTPVDPGVVETAEILVGEHVLNDYVSPGAVVVPVRKTDRNPFSNAVIAGRSATCDLRFDDKSISKVHAYLYPPENRGGGWTIQDQNSTNGTWVNGIMLEKGEVLRIPWSSEVRLGHVRAIFLGPEELESTVDYAQAAWKLAAGKETEKTAADTDDDWKPEPDAGDE